MLVAEFDDDFVVGCQALDEPGKMFPTQRGIEPAVRGWSGILEVERRPVVALGIGMDADGAELAFAQIVDGLDRKSVV